MFDELSAFDAMTPVATRLQDREQFAADIAAHVGQFHEQLVSDLTIVFGFCDKPPNSSADVHAAVTALAYQAILDNEPEYLKVLDRGLKAVADHIDGARKIEQSPDWRYEGPRFSTIPPQSILQSLSIGSFTLLPIRLSVSEFDPNERSAVDRDLVLVTPLRESGRLRVGLFEYVRDRIDKPKIAGHREEQRSDLLGRANADGALPRGTLANQRFARSLAADLDPMVLIDVISRLSVDSYDHAKNLLHSGLPGRIAKAFGSADDKRFLPADKTLVASRLKGLAQAFQTCLTIAEVHGPAVHLSYLEQCNVQNWAAPRDLSGIIRLSARPAELRSSSSVSGFYGTKTLESFIRQLDSKVGLAIKVFGNVDLSKGTVAREAFVEMVKRLKSVDLVKGVFVASISALSKPPVIDFKTAKSDVAAFRIGQKYATPIVTTSLARPLSWVASSDQVVSLVAELIEAAPGLVFPDLQIISGALVPHEGKRSELESALLRALKQGANEHAIAAWSGVLRAYTEAEVVEFAEAVGDKIGGLAIVRAALDQLRDEHKIGFADRGI